MQDYPLSSRRSGERVTRVLIGQLVAFGATPADIIHEAKGALVVGDDGTILWRGPQTLLPQAFNASPRDDFAGKLLMAGFIDIHIHFPQYRMLAAPAKDLLEWLKVSDEPSCFTSCTM